MQKCNENAANRYSYVGEVYGIGEKDRKEAVLKSLPHEWRELHEKGKIHIHDLDAYGLTYNCLTFNLLKDFPFKQYATLSSTRKILGVFEYLKSIFTDIGNEQSGGMALANFDCDLAIILDRLDIDLDEPNKETIASCIYNLIIWCNNTHTRMGQTSYYVTLNIGLAETEKARYIAFTLLDEFEQAGDLVFKPNIVFKVKEGVNRFPTDRNFNLFRKSLLCTAKKMIPTYLLCDSKPNKDIDAYSLAIMGCRTRVVADIFGRTGSIGRGNIDNISINLPNIALGIHRDYPAADMQIKLELFGDRWELIAESTKDILLDRYKKVSNRSLDDFPINSRHHLWIENFDNIESVFKHGTLSIGFIGLTEAMEVLTGKRFYEDDDIYQAAIDFAKRMRSYCDNLREKCNLNFTLLATSGELISGRFIQMDKQEFKSECNIFDKGFYTNSFHVNVDSDLCAFDKIKIEGAFHEICNGGSITYVELGEAPLGNDEGLNEYIECAIDSGVHYLGFNFPKDVCKACGASGVFDECPICGSRDITRIRRVSGYLEVLDGFTYGKKNEEKARRSN